MEENHFRELKFMFLNTEDLLDDDKKNTMQQLIDTMPIYIGIKDASSQYLIGNNLFSKLVGLSDGADIQGWHDNEFNCFRKIAHLFVERDARVMKKNCIFNILTYTFDANNKPILLYGKKYPMTDKNGIILACGFFLQDVTVSQLINLAPLLSLCNTAHGSRQLGNQFSYIITESVPEYLLSNRQTECLFHLLRGQSANDISLTLNISKRTVETHIDDIKSKLGCDTKAQLIDKAICSGLLNYIPSSLIKTAL